MIPICVAAVVSLMFAQPQDDQKKLVSDLPVDTVDCVVVKSMGAGSAGAALDDLFSKLGVKPRYRVVPFALPGIAKANLVFVRGRDGEVRLIKKLLAAMDEAYGVGEAADIEGFLMQIPAGEIGAGEMMRRLLEAANGAGLGIAEEDFTIYPAGESGKLFYIGDGRLAARVTELSSGLDRTKRLALSQRIARYFYKTCGEVAASFSVALSAAVSALALVLVHVALCRIPGIGNGYRRSFKYFWESLFAAFKGKDLAWEIIQAAAELGVASAEREVTTRGGLGVPEGRRRAEAPVEIKSIAMRLASDYAGWRGVKTGEPLTKRLLEGAVEVEMRKVT
jgi:hypothetical protein